MDGSWPPARLLKKPVRPLASQHLNHGIPSPTTQHRVLLGCGMSPANNNLPFALLTRIGQRPRIVHQLILALTASTTEYMLICASDIQHKLIRAGETAALQRPSWCKLLLHLELQQATKSDHGRNREKSFQPALPALVPIPNTSTPYSDIAPSQPILTSTPFGPCRSNIPPDHGHKTEQVDKGSGRPVLLRPTNSGLYDSRFR
jgi:hypothetical protein